MWNDLDGKLVVISGGTGGIGVAMAMAFSRAGARVCLTHRWGSQDEDELRQRFENAGLTPPLVVEADASQKDDTKRLVELLKGEHEHIEVFINNVCVVPRGGGLDDHSRRGLLQATRYSSWPLLGYLQKIQKSFGKPPRYVIATSSDGADTYYPGYDYVAISKSILETFVRYAAIQYRHDDCRINVLRTRQVITESYRRMFAEHASLIEKFPEFVVDAEEVASTALAMCSGLLDAMSGQVLTVDKAAGFCDNIVSLGPQLLSNVRSSNDHE